MEISHTHSETTIVLHPHAHHRPFISGLERLRMDNLGHGVYGSESYVYVDGPPFIYHLLKALRTNQVSRTRYFSFGEDIGENWNYNKDKEDDSDPHALKNLLQPEDGYVDLRALLKSQQKSTNSIFFFNGYECNGYE